MIKKISHVAIVVPDLEEATRFWRDALGLQLDNIERVEQEGVDIAFLPVGESEIELISPIDDLSGVAKYMEKRGPGMHHICLEVDDIVAILDRLEEFHIPLITQDVMINEHGTKYVFVHPKGTNGVLVELYELPQDKIV